MVNQLSTECASIREYSTNFFNHATKAKTLKEFETELISEFEETHNLIDYANANLVATRHLLKKAELEMKNINL